MRLKHVSFMFALAALLLILPLTACKNETSLPLFQVNDVVSDPGAFTKPLQIEGVVYAYAQNSNDIVGIMDKKELQCTTPNCNKVLLAVRISGERPAIGAEIRATGSIIKEGEWFVMNTTQTQVITTHKLGK